MVIVRISIVSLITITLITLTGCSKSWWGEPRQGPSVIRLASSGPSCPDPTLVLKGTEAESLAAFDCLVSKISKVWTQVEGKQKERLSDSEIEALVRKDVIQLNSSRDLSVRLVRAYKNLVGMSDDVTKEKVDRMIALLRQNRASLRNLYHGSDGFIEYSDLESVSRFLATLFREVNWIMKPDQLAGAIQAVFEGLPEILDSQLRSAIMPAAWAGINLLNTLCPTFSQKDVWHTTELAACLELAASHFKPASAWFEFLVNPVHAYSNDEVASIRRAHDLFLRQEKLKNGTRESGLVIDWFKMGVVSNIETARWVALSEMMGARPPSNFTESLQLIEKFSSQSTKNSIHPSAIIRFLYVSKEVHGLTLDGLPFYVELFQQRRCRELSDTWKTCVPSIADLQEARGRLWTIDLAMKVKSIHHGQQAAPLSGAAYTNMMLFYAIAGQILSVYAKDQSELITANFLNRRDEVLQLIDQGVDAYDTVHRFFGNMTKRLKGHRLDESGLMQDLRELDLKGLAKLITMTSDVLVMRDQKDKDLFMHLVANLTNVLPQSASKLDRLAITSAITVIDSLGDYRKSYLDQLGIKAAPDSEVTGAPVLVPRAQLVHYLPQIMEKNFKRTFDSCQAFGFERSCGIALDNILPSAGEDSDGNINASDLDILTIIATGMEGVLDNCDLNRDSKLSWRFLDGSDELDCAYVMFKDITSRLIDSDIVHTSGKVEDEMIKVAMELIGSLSATRILGKSAMAKGNAQHVLFNWFTFWLYNDATIGSIYGLLSDVLDRDHVKDLERNIIIRSRETAVWEKKPVVIRSQ